METNTPQMNVPMAEVPTPVINSRPSGAAPQIPIAVKIIAVLFYIASIAFIFFGILAAFVSSLSLPFLGAFGVSFGLVPGIAIIAWGVLSFFAGRGLWSGQQWGRILAITISGLYIIFGVIAIFILGSANYISLVINLAIILYLLFGKGISAAFQNGKSMTTAAILAILAFAVYTTMEYPILFAPTNTISAVDYNKLMGYHGTPTNPASTQNSTTGQNTTTPQNLATPISDPNYGPVVQGVTQPGIYSNAAYSFQMNIPFTYSVQEKTYSTPGESVLISGTETSMILIAIQPTTLSLQDMIHKEMGDLVANDTFVNTTIAGEPAMQDTGNPNIKNPIPNATVNIYFLIHNGNYYMFQKTGSFKLGQIITDDQFNSAIQSLRFTK